MKPPTPSRGVYELIGDAEQNGKHKKEQKDKNRKRNPNTATLDQVVGSYDPQGSYGEPILLPLPAPTEDIHVYITR